MEIVSKFTVGSDQGVNDFFAVEEPSFIALHKDFVEEQKIEEYIDEHFDHRQKINDLNDLSIQLIITYQDEKPVGYSILKSGSEYPEMPKDKRVTEIIFAILPEYNSVEVQQSLWKKTLSAASFTDIIWINIFQHHYLLNFFKDLGFETVKESQGEPFLLDSYILSLIKISVT